MTPFKRAEEVMDNLVFILQENADLLGIKFVGYGTEKLIPYYPAVDVTSAETQREIHATQQFKVYFNMNLWIYHANLNVGHAVRTKEDLELVTRVVELLHSDFTMNDRLIFSYVHTEDPGITEKGKAAIVTTRIGWTGEARLNFRES